MAQEELDCFLRWLSRDRVPRCSRGSLAFQNPATAAASVGWQAASVVYMCVCVWVNTRPICVKCETKQASRHATWNVLSTELKGNSGSVLAPASSELRTPLLGELAANPTDESAGELERWGARELGSLHQHTSYQWAFVG